MANLIEGIKLQSELGMIFLIIYLGAAAALLVHELGHYAAAIALGTGVLRVDVGCGPAIAVSTTRSAAIWTVHLLPLGGSVTYPISIRETPLKYFVVSAAGPLANLISGAIVLWFVPDYFFTPNIIVQSSASWSVEWLAMFADLSLAIGAFNLLPMPPLDGADIAATVVSFITGRRCSPIGRTATSLGQTLICASSLGFAAWMTWAFLHP